MGNEGRDAYSKAVLECGASDRERLEELRNGLSARLRIPRRACRRALSGRKVRDALCGPGRDVRPVCHYVYVYQVIIVAENSTKRALNRDRGSLYPAEISGCDVSKNTKPSDA